MNRKRVLSAVVLSLVSVLLIVQLTPAFAAKPKKIGFEFGFNFIGSSLVEEEIKGKKEVHVYEDAGYVFMYIYRPEGTEYVYGDFVGTSEETVVYYVPVEEATGSEDLKYADTSQERTCSVTVGGKTGTIIIQADFRTQCWGRGLVPTVSPTFKGTWRIVGGTGDLAGVEGHGKVGGVYGGSPYPPEYTGTIILP